MEQKIVSEKWLYNAISDYTNRHPISGKLVAKKFELMKQLTDERIEKVENSIKESEEKIEQFRNKIISELDKNVNIITSLKIELSHN